MSVEDVTLFKHTPLARITRTSQPFRLLEIKPSSEPSSQIECTLHHANLLTKPKFKALSYVWGDQSLKVPILLDSKRYYVTRNCYGALLRLRELGEKIVWIDAICIDQTNNDEKASQIPQMEKYMQQWKQSFGSDTLQKKDDRTHSKRNRWPLLSWIAISRSVS